MRRQEIAVLSCRILSVYAVVYALGMPIMNLLVLSKKATSVELLVMGWFHFGLLMASALLLWLFSNRIGAHMVMDLETSSEDSPIRMNDIQPVAFSIVGLLVLAQAIPRFVNMLARVLFVHSTQKFDHFMSDGAGFTVQIAIGLWLFFGSRGLVGLLNTMRKGSLASPIKFEE